MQFEDLIPGVTAEMSKTITETDVTLFAGITGDFNPVHIDAVAAARSRFGGRIAHGMLSAGLISAVLGMKLPGPGSIYLSQSLKFTRPVRIGETVTAQVSVASVNTEKRRVTLTTVCRNQDGETVLEGDALVLVPLEAPAFGDAALVRDPAPA